MKRRVLIASFLTLGACAFGSLNFQVDISTNFNLPPQAGRIVVALSRKANPEPRSGVMDTGPGAPAILARDSEDLRAGAPAMLTQDVVTCPIARLADLPEGDYFAQALLMSNPDLRYPGAPGNLYSDVQNIRFDPSHEGTVKLELNHQIPPEQLPPDNESVRFVKIKSELLSRFHKRPIFLRAGVILPRDFDPARKYPLWVRIGGSRSRYTSVNSLMGGNSAFRKTWLADGTPRMILLELDGMGPYGDPYQVNSANNGPYGDAVTQELIPSVEKQFHAVAVPQSRFLSGTSTGGWVALALQIFYPDYFNGAWSSCPDPVDFRAFELVNIYEDTNAYVNALGFERPSERSIEGDVRLTLRREVQVENVLGRRNSWSMSGADWGAWNAVFGPRGADGCPVPLWDPQTGAIDRHVAEEWKSRDLRLVLQQNWKTLAPKLEGKLRIAAADADNFFLNNAVHLLDQSLSHADPPFKGNIVYGARKGHGWTDISMEEMMKEMDARARGSIP